MLPDEVDARLRIEARRRGVPVAEIVREAVAAHVSPQPAGRTLGFFDLGETGDPDASMRVDEHVLSAVRERRAR